MKNKKIKKSIFHHVISDITVVEDVIEFRDDDRRSEVEVTLKCRRVSLGDRRSGIDVFKQLVEKT